MTCTDLRALHRALIVACTAFACGDDGGLDSGGATEESTSNTSTGGDEDVTVTVSATLSTDDSSSGTTPGSSSESDTTEGSTGPGESTGSGDSTGAGDSTGPGESGGTDDETTAAECMPITEDDSAIGNNCMSDGDCPAGYTCQSIEGFQLQQLCAIICTEACECPNENYACQMHEDKYKIWFQCDQL